MGQEYLSAAFFEEHLDAFATLLEAFVILLSVMVSVWVFLCTTKKDHDFQLRRNYQELEFESARIFQVCVDSPEIPLYLEKKISKAEAGRHIAERCYWFVCQTLNIFEVFLSYRRNKMVPPDVFATWVSWFHELGTAPRFKEFWFDEELWSHYKKDLQSIMNKAQEIVRNRSPGFERNDNWYDEELEVFYRKVSHIFEDKSILAHFKESMKRRKAFH